ncbi:unnamed protein product [Arctogadus glacialis]
MAEGTQCVFGVCLRVYMCIFFPLNWNNELHKVSHHIITLTDPPEKKKRKKYCMFFCSFDQIKYFSFGGCNTFYNFMLLYYVNMISSLNYNTMPYCFCF